MHLKKKINALPFSTVMLQTKVWSVLTSNKLTPFFPSVTHPSLFFSYMVWHWAGYWEGERKGCYGREQIWCGNVDLVGFTHLKKKDLFTCFVGLSPKPHLTPLPKSFWHLHLVHSGQALFALLEKVVGARPSPLRGTSVGLCHGKRGISLSSCPSPST